MNIGGTVFEKSKDEAISSRISEQMNILDGLVKLLKKYNAADSHIAGLVTDLNTVKAAYDGFDEVKSYNPDSEKPIVLTAYYVSQLGVLINRLRTKFVAA